MEQNTTIDSWEKYITNFIENEDVDDEKDAFIVVEVQEVSREDKVQIRLTLEKANIKYAFDLNKTNSVFCKINGKVKHPRELSGKKLYFRKVKAYSPNAKKEVDSLRICKIE